MKKTMLILLVLSFMVHLFCEEAIKTSDKLDYRGKYKEALDILLKAYDPSDPDPKIIWRIASVTFELAEVAPNKEERIKMYDIGINTTKPHMDINAGTKRDRAEIVHWYTVNYASKIKSLGIFGGRESMTIVPTIFKLMDKCYSIDPTYVGTYFFRAKLQEEVPFFLGGNRLKMAINYDKAIRYAGKDHKVLILIDAAKGFLRRNWSIDKKNKKLKDSKEIENDGTPPNMNDREYAIQLLKEAKQLYEDNENPSEREKIKFKEALIILKKMEDKK